MLRGGGLAVLLLVAACSSSPSNGQPVATTTTAPVIAVVDDGTPVITMHFTCYGECAYLWPGDLPQVAVYADGTVVAAEFPQGEGDPPLVMTTGHVTADQVQALAIAATEAGLRGQGRLPNSRLPDGIEIADGGGTVFTYRSGPAIAVREVEHLYAGDDFSQVGDRVKLLALQQTLRTIAETATDPLPITQWAVVFEPQAIVNEVPEWPGPDLSTVPAASWGDLRCAILPGAAWALTATATYDEYYVSGGSTWFVSIRPLLPHEHGCDDVFAWWRTR